MAKNQQTLMNEEPKRYAISTPINVLYPNIVITNPDRTIRELGTVESREDISRECVPRWKALTDAASFEENVSARSLTMDSSILFTPMHDNTLLQSF